MLERSSKRAVRRGDYANANESAHETGWPALKLPIVPVYAPMEARHANRASDRGGLAVRTEVGRATLSCVPRW